MCKLLLERRGSSSSGAVRHIKNLDTHTVERKQMRRQWSLLLLLCVGPAKDEGGESNLVAIIARVA